jgi:hypothetical protein
VSFVVKVVDRAGAVTWLARKVPDGERLFGSRKVAEVFHSREEAQTASAKAVHSDGLPGMVFSVEVAD